MWWINDWEVLDRVSKNIKKKTSHTHARALARRTQSHMSLFRIAIQRQSKHAVAGGTTHAIPTFCVVVYFFILTSVKAMNKTKNNRRKLDHNKSGCWLCDRTFAVLKTTLKSICSHQNFIVLRPSKVTCGNICGSSICVWLWFEFESNSVQYIDSGSMGCRPFRNTAYVCEKYECVAG